MVSQFRKLRFPLMMRITCGRRLHCSMPGSQACRPPCICAGCPHFSSPAQAPLAVLLAWRWDPRSSLNLQVLLRPQVQSLLHVGIKPTQELASPGKAGVGGMA